MTAFNVDHEKLFEISSFLNEKSEELDTLYNELLDICDKIEENYKSEDSSIYLSRFRKNINTFINENEVLKDGGQVLKKVSSLYGNQEEKWANKVKQEILYDRRED